MADKLDWLNQHPLWFLYPTVSQVVTQNHLELSTSLQKMAERFPIAEDYLKALWHEGQFKDACTFCAYNTAPRVAVWWAYLCTIDLKKELLLKPAQQVKISDIAKPRPLNIPEWCPTPDSQDFTSAAQKTASSPAMEQSSSSASNHAANHATKNVTQNQAATNLNHESKQPTAQSDLDHAVTSNKSDNSLTHNKNSNPDSSTAHSNPETKKKSQTDVDQEIAQELSKMREAHQKMQSAFEEFKQIMPQPLINMYLQSLEAGFKSIKDKCGYDPRELLQDVLQNFKKLNDAPVIDELNSPIFKASDELKQKIEKLRVETADIINSVVPEPDQEKLDKLTTQCLDAVWDYISAPNETNAQNAFQLGNTCPNQIEGLLSSIAFWSFGSLTPNSPTLIKTPAGLMANGINGLMTKCATSIGGIYKPQERFERYFNLAFAVLTNQKTWDLYIERNTSPHQELQKEVLEFLQNAGSTSPVNAPHMSSQQSHSHSPSQTMSQWPGQDNSQPQNQTYSQGQASSPRQSQPHTQVQDNFPRQSQPQSQSQRMSPWQSPTNLQYTVQGQSPDLAATQNTSSTQVQSFDHMQSFSQGQSFVQGQSFAQMQGTPNEPSNVKQATTSVNSGASLNSAGGVNLGASLNSAAGVNSDSNLNSTSVTSAAALHSPVNQAAEPMTQDNPLKSGAPITTYNNHNEVVAAKQAAELRIQERLAQVRANLNRRFRG